MIKDFAKAWEKNKDELRTFFKENKQEVYCESYKDLLTVVIDKVINPYLKDINKEGFNIEDIETIDFGDYQGTIIFTFHIDTYQPDINETYYTHVDYGSCAGCDTLQNIYHYEEELLPNDTQIDDYLSLSLHLIQHIKVFGNDK